MALLKTKVSLLPLLVFGYIRSHFILFSLGLILGLIAIISIPKLVAWLPQNQRYPVVGLVGNYTLSTLPFGVQEKISFGITTLTPTGEAAPGASTQFYATDEGKKAIITIRDDLYWQDGQKFNLDDIQYTLKGAKIDKATNHLEINLTEPYGPLFTILSQPLFKPGTTQTLPILPAQVNDLFFKTSLVGLGDYKVVAIKKNGRFVAELDLVNKEKKHLTYKFYPSSKEALEALKLGQVNEIDGVRLSSSWQNNLGHSYQLIPKIDGRSLVILFYNTADGLLAEKTTRQALTYALPDTFNDGEETASPFPKDSWAESNNQKMYTQSLPLAKATLAKIASSSAGQKIALRLFVAPTLLPTAQEISQAWEKVGVSSIIKTTDLVEPRYQAFLTTIELPADPDQYFLWHQTQRSNISNYKSFKVDKLLEEARRTFNLAERKTKYAEFERAITEDVPAVFLYYPTKYDIKRKY